MGDQASPDTQGNGSLPWLAACQPKSFLRACLLLLLDEEPAYGYELRERLHPFRDGTWDQGTVYRFLNTMEQEGLVTSHWERSRSGPQRRRYRLTHEGRHVLAAWAQSIDSLSEMLLRFSERYRLDIAAHPMRDTPAPTPVMEPERVPSP